MRFSTVAAASWVAPLVAAHGDHIPGAPKVVGLGGKQFGKLRGRSNMAARRAVPVQAGPQLEARQGGLNGRCGPEANGASCDEGYCCSVAGYCGQGIDYCRAPDCLFEYGPACDANQTPGGSSTRNVPRPQLGSIPYGGGGIYVCTEPGTVAVTYDDGPYIYTNDVMDMFADYGFKATFFITGNNLGKGPIDDPSEPWPAMINRMISEGHQVASHTWSHQDLSAITQEQRIDQMVKNEMAIRNVIGQFPTYMRPPYSSCTNGCPEDMADLGYVVSYFDLDTDDYNNLTPERIQNSKDRVADAIVGSNPQEDEFLAIAHDIHELTAHNLTAMMLETIAAEGYRGVTMGECLGDPESNWYRDSAPGGDPPSSTTSVAPTATPTGPVSQDGTCGGDNGYSCIGFELGSCCSQYGWCGSTSDHCGTGCNPLFGTCGSSSSGTPSAPASSTAATPSSTPTGQVSPDGTCGGDNGYTCNGFPEGSCCSQYGYCGSTDGHCGTGCNPLFGTCGGSSEEPEEPEEPADPTPTGTVTSPDGTCGGTTNYNCIGFELGSCCSQYGYCGSTTGHCGTGCNPEFGTCGSNSSPAVSSAPAPPNSIVTSVRPSAPVSTSRPSSTSEPVPGPNVSTNGRCGGREGTTCKGFGNRECCSWSGVCGGSIFACGIGCNSDYGNCWW